MKCRKCQKDQLNSWSPICDDCYLELSNVLAENEKLRAAALEYAGSMAKEALRREKLERQIVGLRAENKLLQGTMRADDERLLNAANKSGAIFTGCDTADSLADEILKLRKALRGTKP